MKKRKLLYKGTAVLSMCLMTMAAAAGCGRIGGKSTALNPKNPVTVTVWNYYNGDQLAAFDQLVEDFNSTTGMEKGIVVVDVSQGDIGTLADSLLAAVNSEPGAQDIPDLAAVYSETAYVLDQGDALQALDSYFTEEELSAYVQGFLEEGRFNSDNELLLFPILKSTELFSANETDWAPFAADTGITLESIDTKEKLTAAAEAYYHWTDAQTPDVSEDGKALYGRDSMANYMYIGSYQLGHELFKVENGVLTVDMDRDTFKTLWDNYYIPYINGYFGAYANFRSEDCKTGRILSLTASSSGINYLPDEVTLSDDTTYGISIYEAKDPAFADAVSDGIVQQGASYCLMKSTEARQEGAVEFLKWFTEPERNLEFAMMSGYLPVTVEANNADTIAAAYSGDSKTQKGQNVLKALEISADAFSTTSSAYAGKPFGGSKDIRSLLDDAMQETADADREKVLAAISAGETREAAVAPYITDAYFDEWFNVLSAEVDKIIESQQLGR